MSNTVNTFEYKTYNKTKIKYKRGTNKMQEIALEIPKINDEITELTGTLTTLINTSFASDQWIRDVQDSIQISDLIAQNVKDISLKMVNDIETRVEDVQGSNTRLAASVGTMSGTVGAILNDMQGNGGSNAPSNSSNGNSNANTDNNSNSGNNSNTDSNSSNPDTNNSTNGNQNSSSDPGTQSNTDPKTNNKDNNKKKKVSETDEYDYNKTITYGKKNDVDLSKDKNLNGYISQGMTDAGDYKIYGFIKKDGDKTVSSAIRIVDKDGNVVKTYKTDDVDVIGHANDLEYDPTTGKVYIATMNKDAPLKSFNLNDAVNSDGSKIKFKDESDLFDQSGMKNCSGFTIDQSTGNKYFASGDKIKVVDKNGDVVQTIKKANDDNAINNHESQGIFAKDGNLYVIRYNRDSNHTNGGTDVRADSTTASANMIDVFDSNGNYTNTIAVEAPTYTNEKGNTVIGEMESISYNENTGKFEANFYYKTNSSDDSSRAYCTVNLKMNSSVDVK